MEGSESEQEKSVKRGTEESQGRRKRVEKKKKHGASRLQTVTDVSQGGSDESSSRVEGGVDASQGSSECRLVKCKSFKKKKHASRLQKGTDVFEGDVAGGSDCHQVKRKRVKEDSLAWIDEYLDLTHANMALEFYEKSQDVAEFEILEVLNTSNSRLQHPEHPNDIKSLNLWSHISFIAKPKKADCNVSPTHFFGEFFRDVDSGETNVTYCSTFQPSDDPGFNHGCIFCPRGLKFHPSDGYCVGRPPWHRRSRRNVGYVQPPWVSRKA